MNVYEIVTDKIIKQLEAGVAPWTKPWTAVGTNGWPMNMISGKPYNGINVFLLLITDTGKYTSPYWMTYKQAVSLGGHVRTGEKATIITFWKQSKYTKKNDETGKDEDKRSMILRYYSVFNLEQCEGIESPDAETVPAPIVNKIDAAEAVIANMPVKPQIQYDTRAFYRPSTDTIGVPTIAEFTNPESYYSTLFHELVHSTGHESRIGRDDVKKLSTQFGSDDYSKEELVAELGAAMLCGMLGIERTINNSAAYLQHWIERLRGDSKLIISAASQAQKAADFILGRSAVKVEETVQEEASV